MAPLTGPQAQLLQAIERYSREHGVSPTMRELASLCGIASTNTISQRLVQLERQGHIERRLQAARGIRLVDAIPRQALLEIPVLGTIAAGEPLPVFDEAGGAPSSEWRDVVAISATMINGQATNLFALRVQGQSMIDALIDDGDTVILRHAERCDNGAIVAVWLVAEASTTLKHFFDEGDRIRLQPANPTIPPMFHSPTNVLIQGQLVGVLRHVA